jgi:hypothetical protein
MTKESLLVATLLLVASPASAHSINAKLTCGAHTGDAQSLRAFEAVVPFEVSAGRLEGKRTMTERGGGEESFTGTINAQGEIQLSGQGSYKSGAAWVYELSGTRRKNGETVLSGEFTSTAGLVGVRLCKLRFPRGRPLM